jgi:hypothetical protein
VERHAQRVVESVAFGISDVGEAVGGIVGVGDGDAVRIGERSMTSKRFTEEFKAEAVKQVNERGYWALLLNSLLDKTKRL